MNKQRLFRTFLKILINRRSHVTLVSSAQDRYGQLQEADPSVGVPQLKSFVIEISKKIFKYFRFCLESTCILYSKPYPTVRASCREAFPLVGVPQLLRPHLRRFKVRSSHKGVWLHLSITGNVK